MILDGQKTGKLLGCFVDKPAAFSVDAGIRRENLQKISKRNPGSFGGNDETRRHIWKKILILTNYVFLLWMIYGILNKLADKRLEDSRMGFSAWDRRKGKYGSNTS